MKWFYKKRVYECVQKGHRIFEIFLACYYMRFCRALILEACNDCIILVSSGSIVINSTI